MYLTYEEYENMGGKTLEETAFEQFEFEARAHIDWWTFSRLQNETEYPEAVKRCMFKLINLLVDKQTAMIVDGQTTDTNNVTKAGITSESNDGVSATYNTLSASEAVKALEDELEGTIRMYLAGVKNSLGRLLLYRGLSPNE